MKLIIPKEHGAWAMWIAPYIIGMLLAGPKWIHLLLLISIFFAYISVTPLLQGIRRPKEQKEMFKLSFIYLLIAGILGFPVLINHPKLLFILLLVAPFFAINIYFVRIKRERAFLNDLAGVIGLSSTLLVAYYIGLKEFSTEIFIVWLLIILFFVGSIFFVKSKIREKNNVRFKLVGKIYSVILPIFALIFFDIYLMIAYLFSTFRLFWFAKEENPSPIKTGIIEIVNSIWFVIFIVLSFRL